METSHTPKTHPFAFQLEIKILGLSKKALSLRPTLCGNKWYHFWKWTLGLAQGGEEISKIPVIIHLLSTIPSVDNGLRWEEIESSFKMPYALIL